ncbi:hypothetical protein [Dysgonomonas termitidis]|uniref:Uncharacterized protein n=1 Tax=Dysgonomonas termitidis TaxID=1516126 RepID=A0ABV9L109_9BACT
MEMTNEFWDFIEENLPNYYTRDDVLRHSNLQLLVDGEESCITDLTPEEAKAELEALSLKLYTEAIDAFTQKV